MRIALTGPAYSGKTTLADYLEENCGWTKLSFTDRIKGDLAKALSAIKGRPVTVTEIVGDKENTRPLLKALAAYLGYNQGYGMKELLDEWLATKLPNQYENDVVWDCVRYPEQADILVENSFVIVEMNVEMVTQQTRAYLKGVSAGKLDELMGLEADEGVTPDMWLDGSESVERLADTLVRLSGRRRHKPAVKTPDLYPNLYVKYGNPASLGMN